MKIIRFIVGVFLILAMLNVSSESHAAKSGSNRTDVRTYTTKKGKVVKPHSRTKKDKSKNNNYTSKGMVNPSTGKKGTKTPK